MNSRINTTIFGHGKPLILLHGWGWDSTIWNPLVPALAEHYQLFLVDLPGFGKSAPLVDSYSCEAVATALFEAVPAQATWLGWSLGGMLAWWIALHHPHKVSRLITIAASPKFIADKHWPGVSTATLKKFHLDLKNDLAQTLQDFVSLQLRGSTQIEISDLSQPFVTSTGLEGGLDLLESIDLRAQLDKLSCPSLHLFGSNDTLIPKAIAALIQPSIRQGQCEIIPRAGHIPFLSHPEIFLNAIHQFML